MADRMVSDGMLIEDARGLVAAGGGPRTRGADLEAAGRVLAGAAAERAQAGPSGMQYLPDAPSRLYASYRGRLLSLLHGRLYGRGAGPGVGDIDLAMSDAYADIPKTGILEGFTYPYDDHTRIVLRLLEENLTDGARRQIYGASEGVFRTLADGLRVLYHDEYFEPEVPGWRAEFEDSRARMERETDGLHDLASGLGMADTGRMAFPDLVEMILEARSRGRLQDVSFVPWKTDRGLDDGMLGTEFFHGLSDDEFRGVLYKFRGAYNAIITMGTGGRFLEGGVYRITGPAPSPGGRPDPS